MASADQGVESNVPYSGASSFRTPGGISRAPDASGVVCYSCSPSCLALAQLAVPTVGSIYITGTDVHLHSHRCLWRWRAQWWGGVGLVIVVVVSVPPRLVLDMNTLALPFVSSVMALQCL